MRKVYRKPTRPTLWFALGMLAGFVLACVSFVISFCK